MVGGKDYLGRHVGHHKKHYATGKHTLDGLVSLVMLKSDATILKVLSLKDILGLPLGPEAPVMTPNGVIFLSFLQRYAS